MSHLLDAMYVAFAGLSAILLIAAGCASSPPKLQVEPRDVDLSQRLCVNSHMPTGDDAASQARRNAEYTWLADAGVTCVRFDFRWFRIEPEPYRFELTEYDRVVDELATLGVTTIALVSSAPEWARRGGDSNISPDDFARLMQRLSTHFLGRVRLWELWNEPNWMFWEPEPDPAAYARLAIAGTRAVRQADPAALVISAGMLSIADILQGEEVWSSIDRVLQAEPELVDELSGIGVHTYTWLQSWRPERNEGPSRPSIAAMLDHARAVLERHGAAAMPLYNTETGWSTNLVGEQNKARYLIRAALISLALGVERFTAFNLTGADPNGDAPVPAENGYGLLRWDPDPLDDEDPEPEPAGQAFARLARSLAGMYLVTEAPWTDIPREDGLFSVSAIGENRLLRFVWSSDPEQPQTIDIQHPTGYRLISTSTFVGRTVTQTVDDRATIGDDPVVFEYLLR